MGSDLDFQDGAVVGSGEGSEGLTALRAVLLVGRHVEGFRDDRQVAVVAALGSGASLLLAAWSRRLGWRDGRGGVGQRGGVLGLAAEQALFQGANAGLKGLDLLLQALLALHGALVHALPVGGLPPRFKLGGQTRADGARLGGRRRRRARRGGVTDRQKDFHAGGSLQNTFPDGHTSQNRRRTRQQSGRRDPRMLTS